MNKQELLQKNNTLIVTIENEHKDLQVSALDFTQTKNQIETRVKQVLSEDEIEQTQLLTPINRAFHKLTNALNLDQFKSSLEAIIEDINKIEDNQFDEQVDSAKFNAQIDTIGNNWEDAKKNRQEHLEEFNTLVRAANEHCGQLEQVRNDTTEELNNFSDLEGQLFVENNENNMAGAIQAELSVEFSRFQNDFPRNNRQDIFTANEMTTNSQIAERLKELKASSAALFESFKSGVKSIKDEYSAKITTASSQEAIGNLIEDARKAYGEVVVEHKQKIINLFQEKGQGIVDDVKTLHTQVNERRNRERLEKELHDNLHALMNAEEITIQNSITSFEGKKGTVEQFAVDLINVAGVNVEKLPESDQQAIGLRNEFITERNRLVNHIDFTKKTAGDALVVLKQAIESYSSVEDLSSRIETEKQHLDDAHRDIDNKIAELQRKFAQIDNNPIKDYQAHWATIKGENHLYLQDLQTRRNDLLTNVQDAINLVSQLVVQKNESAENARNNELSDLVPDELSELERLDQLRTEINSHIERIQAEKNTLQETPALLLIDANANELLEADIRRRADEVTDFDKLDSLLNEANGINLNALVDYDSSFELLKRTVKLRHKSEAMQDSIKAFDDMETSLTNRYEELVQSCTNAKNDIDAIVAEAVAFVLAGNYNVDATNNQIQQLQQQISNVLSSKKLAKDNAILSGADVDDVRNQLEQLTNDINIDTADLFVQLTAQYGTLDTLRNTIRTDYLAFVGDRNNFRNEIQESVAQYNELLQNINGEVNAAKEQVDSLANPQAHQALVQVLNNAIAPIDLASNGVQVNHLSTLVQDLEDLTNNVFMSLTIGDLNQYRNDFQTLTNDYQANHEQNFSNAREQLMGALTSLNEAVANDEQEQQRRVREQQSRRMAQYDC